MDAAMPSDSPATFHDHFGDLKDPRVQRTLYHPLINILFIAVCGVLSGANSFAGIHEFGSDRRQWFARYLDLANGIPSDDTFARVLARLDPAAFEYGGRCKLIQVLSRTGLWHRRGCDPVAIRYVLARDPEGKQPDAAYFCTDGRFGPEEILRY